MCLSKMFNEQKTQKIVKKLPEIISVYKIVQKNKKNKRYLPYFFDRIPYIEGENREKNEKTWKEISSNGFYSFKNLLSTKLVKFLNMNDPRRVIIKCKINKKDIKRIGRDRGVLTFVTSKITIPKYKE